VWYLTTILPSGLRRQRLVRYRSGNGHLAAAYFGIGAVIWFGFSLLPTIIHYAYEDRTFSLLAINKGYDFLGIEIAAIILSVWR